MPPLIQADWAKIRHDYEHSTRPIPDICAEHGISTGTLRDRVRRWGWARRWLPIPAEGPPSLPPPVETATAHVWHRAEEDERAEAIAQPGTCMLVEETPTPTLPLSGGGSPGLEPSPHLETPAGTRPIGERLQGAVARVLPAIEATLEKLAAGPVRPREMELAARALGSLTRTLRELNGLLDQHRAHPVNESPEDVEEMRAGLLRAIEGVIASEKEAIPGRYLAAWDESAADAARKT